jgi:hypothetical protein
LICLKPKQHFNSDDYYYAVSDSIADDGIKDISAVVADEENVLVAEVEEEDEMTTVTRGELAMAQREIDGEYAGEYVVQIFPFYSKVEILVKSRIMQLDICVNIILFKGWNPC